MTLLDYQKENAAEILAMFDAPKWEPILNQENQWILETLANKKGRKAFEGQVQFVIAPQFHSFINGNKAGIINLLAE